jgi:Ca-activated chloride channel family protein
LLDEIRLNGENSELKNEVIALAKEFGLVTPYTSYLVQEEERLTWREQDVPLNMPQSRTEAAPRMSVPQPTTMDMLQQTSGAGAVQMSKSVQAMKSAEVASAVDAKELGIVNVNGINLRQQAGGAWMDLDYKTGTATIKLAFASEAYFNFLRGFPEARDFCKLGNKVIFRFRGKFVQIGESGEKQISEAKWREMFR